MQEEKTNRFRKRFIMVLCGMIVLCGIMRGVHGDEKVGTLKCVVAESSELITLESGMTLQYLIVRHYDVKDRPAFSEWLHRNAGSYIQFGHNSKVMKGYIGRLKLCFGRGMLIVKTDNKIEPKSILFIPH